MKNIEKPIRLEMIGFWNGYDRLKTKLRKRIASKLTITSER
jgi:hypothetical protein